VISTAQLIFLVSTLFFQLEEDIRLTSRKTEKPKIATLKERLFSSLKFFGKTWVWSGILLGFFWFPFSVFLLTVASELFQNTLVQAILIFPLWLSNYLIIVLYLPPNATRLDIENALSYVIILSFVIGISVALTFTYAVHKIYFRYKQRKEM